MATKPTMRNVKAGLIGFLVGRGKSAAEIARTIGDGMKATTVEAARRHWQLPDVELEGKTIVDAHLAAIHHSLLGERAREAGLPRSEWARQVITAAIREDLYAVVTDGRFNAGPKRTR